MDVIDLFAELPIKILQDWIQVGWTEDRHVPPSEFLKYIDVFGAPHIPNAITLLSSVYGLPYADCEFQLRDNFVFREEGYGIELQKIWGIELCPIATGWEQARFFWTEDDTILIIHHGYDLVCTYRDFTEFCVAQTYPGRMLGDWQPLPL